MPKVPWDVGFTYMLLMVLIPVVVGAGEVDVESQHRGNVGL